MSLYRSLTNEPSVSSKFLWNSENLGLILILENLKVVLLNSILSKPTDSRTGEGKRRKEFAEWHNYAKYEICGMT